MIGFYCSSISWGGLEMNFVRYAKWFAERGHGVTLFCVAGSPIAENAEGLNVIHVRRNRKYFDVSSAFRLQKLFREQGVQVIWLRDARDFSTIGWAKTFSGNAFKVVYQQAMQLGVKKRDFIHTLRFRKIDAWIALLPFLAEQVKTHTRINPEKIHVVPLATKMEHTQEPVSKTDARQQLTLPEAPFIIGLLGRITHLKGHGFLVEQLAELRKRGLNVELLFVGESTREEGDTYLNQLKARVAELQLSEHVHFRPFMSDVATFYGTIDLFVMASQGETFGNVTIESMVSGVPVLGTNASGTPEILEHGKLGFLYEVDDGKDFCKQVEWIVKNPEAVSEKAQTAMQVARSKYNRETVCGQLEAVLQSLGYSKV